MSIHSFTTAMHAVRRAVPTLALTSALAISALGPAVPGRAEAAARPIDAGAAHGPANAQHEDLGNPVGTPLSPEPAARLQVVVKEVSIWDDRDWHSEGDMRLGVELATCPADVRCDSSSGRLVASSWTAFGASTGDTVTLDRVFPHNDRFAVNAESYTLVHGPQYRLILSLWDEDDGLGAVNDDLGFVELELTRDNGWGVGTHTMESRAIDDPGESGDFKITFEVRAAPFPDLRPVNIAVQNLPGSVKKRVCMAVVNSGLGVAGSFQIVLHVDEFGSHTGSVLVSSLAPGNDGEWCVETARLSPGQHTLWAVVDEPRAVDEAFETNNVFELSYQATGPAILATPSPKPSAALPDLTVDAIKVNGRVPDGKDDCKDGKNTVTVLVKNAGKATAGRFAVRLMADGEAADDEQVGDLEAGQEREVRFGGVRLKKGQHTLTATVDPEKAVAESDEGNNALTVTASCKDDG